VGGQILAGFQEGDAMTREEILNMEAGQEIDELVAEKVMGWHIVTEGRRSPAWYDSEGRYQHHVAADYESYEDDENFHLVNWHPSQSMLWAEEVVEKFYSMKLDKYSNGEEWRCYLVMGKDGVNADGNGVANTAPLAICRAALLVVMESK